MDRVTTEALVVGAGVVGLAIARELSKNNIETILIEKNTVLGDEVSSRNSGVIHAGFYYPQKSLKAQFCNIGNKFIYEYCHERGIYAKRTGKIIVSSDIKSLDIFKSYSDNAIKTGGQELQLLSKTDLSLLEPNISSEFGLLSPETGVLDIHNYIASLENDFTNLGGTTALTTKFIKCIKKNGVYISTLNTAGEEFEISSRILIIAAGLHSDKLRNQLPLKNSLQVKALNYSKGHYFKLSGAPPFKHLIYPLPSIFSLGIHAGFDIDGSVRFGPDTNQTSEINYSFDIDIKNKFVTAIRDYWPSLNPERLREDYVGIRPKIQKEPESFTDFSILSRSDHGLENFIFLQGIESPGLTCSVPIAKYIFNLIEK